MGLHAILTAVFVALILCEACLILYGIGEILAAVLWPVAAYVGAWCWVRLEDLLYALMQRLARLERRRRERKEVDGLPD
jgi:hypothetical protein